MELTTVWFALIAVLWMGYFALEGFDFGVGMLLPVLAKNDTERRVLINTIGPVWDGNEVWLLVAGGATFAAFPEWYATLFSGFYLPLLLILVALIVRGLAFEYRAKRDDDQWRARWDLAIIVGSFVPALLWGVAFANILRGVPIDADMEYVGGFFNLLNPYALLGGAMTLLLFLTHGAMFISLKTDGRIRADARGAGGAPRSRRGGRRGDVPRLDPGHDRHGGLRGRLRGVLGRSGGRPARHPRRTGRLGVPRHVPRHHHRCGRAVPRPVPGRDADLVARWHQPDDRERRRDAVHAEDHDRGRRHLHACGARLPGLDLLGLPQADRRPPHPGTSLRPRRPMRPLDPRLRPHLAPARRELAGVLVTGVVGSVLVLAQAWVVTGLVLAALHDGDVAAAGAWVVAVLVLRGLVGWAGDVLAASAASRVGTSLRRRLVLAAAESPPGTATGEVAALITRGVAAAEPYLTRYVPALVLAAVLPPLAVIAVASQDLLSGVIVLVTLPLVPVFGALVGLATRDKAREQWTALASLSGHFVDVVRGLPTLVAHRRARAQSARIAHITDRCRRTSLATLRIAFASSAVLELVATLSVALVAVTVGVRLAAGSLDLHTALVVLLLAPEAYWPLRRVGAEFHAAAEGVATFETAEVLLGEPPGRGRGGRARRCGSRPRPGERDLRGSLDAGAPTCQRRDPGARGHRREGTVRLRQDDPAVGDGNPAGAHQRDGAARRGDGGRRRLAQPGGVAPATSGVRGRLGRRQPAPGGTAR